MSKYFADNFTVQMSSVYCIFVIVSYLISYLAIQNILFFSMIIFFNRFLDQFSWNRIFSHLTPFRFTENYFYVMVMD